MAREMTTLNIHFSSADGVLRADDQVLASPGLKRREFDLGLGRQMTAMNTAPDYIVVDVATLALVDNAGRDVFAFPWGGVVARAGLKSTWCGIEVWYA